MISRTEITESIIIFLINLQNVGSQIAAQLLQKLLDIYDLWDLKQIAEKACRYIYEVGLKKKDDTWLFYPHLSIFDPLNSTLQITFPWLGCTLSDDQLTSGNICHVSQ